MLPEKDLQEGDLSIDKRKQLLIEDFFDTSRLNKKEKATLKNLFENRIVFQYTLPRKGTTIEMSIGTIPFDMEYRDIFEDAGLENKIEFKCVLFKWINEEWVKESKKENLQIN